MQKITEKDLQDLLITSFRYCLGRRTGISKECADRLVKYWDQIEPPFQSQIRRDIKQAIEHGNAGSKEDVRQWERVLERGDHNN